MICIKFVAMHFSSAGEDCRWDTCLLCFILYMTRGGGAIVKNGGGGQLFFKNGGGQLFFKNGGGGQLLNRLNNAFSSNQITANSNLK